MPLRRSRLWRAAERSRRLAAATVASTAVLCGVIGLAPAWAEGPPGPHSDLPCNACHVTGAGGLPTAPVGMSADAEELCLVCHGPGSESPGTGHPSAFVPTRPLPAAYPLDPQGRITCSSCHQVHSEQPMLLRSGGAWSCRDCHPK